LVTPYVAPPKRPSREPVGRFGARVKEQRSGASHFEVDHLISLELGGADVAENLWPQSYDTQPWNAHVKDKLEDRLHALVCAGKMPLEQAQRDMATDWIAAYHKYVALP
jgi:hypothetical protein